MIKENDYDNNRNKPRRCKRLYNYCIKNTLVSLEECELEFDFLLGYAKDKGYYSLTLNVWADNLGALGFYEREGLRAQKIGMEKIIDR